MEQLLTTKLYIPPIRPDLVTRSRLINQLNNGLHHKLTLISAPAGFGKTTLVSDWLKKLPEVPEEENQTEYLIAWLSLDEGDNDPVRFLTYYIAALNQIEGLKAPFGEGALNMLRSLQPSPIKAVLTSLINETASISGKIIIVFDDYHLIEAQPVHDALNFLLENLPPQMHLVIATREDPHIPLSRLRARNQITDLRAADLSFTTSEAADFLNQTMNLSLSTLDVNALETRTEGWIAGLQLAAISMQGQEDPASFINSFTGSHRLVLDYLIEEVLNHQPENIQTFMLQTSVLDRLTGSLCHAVSGEENSQEILEMLEHANMFIVPLDNERRWYRYHHLFADLLRKRLRQTFPEKVPILHRKASEWNEHNGFIDEAIENSLAARDFERTVYLIEEHFGVNLINKYVLGDQAILRHWLAEIPEEFIFSKPHLCILHAWNLFTNGQLDAVDQILQATEKILDHNTKQKPVSSLDKDHLSDTNRMRLVGMVAIIRSFLASSSGDIPRTIQYTHQALENLPEKELHWRTVALITLGDAYASNGQITAAHEARLDALEISKASGSTYLLMIVNLRLAEILRQQGKLQQVIDICKGQFNKAEESGFSSPAIVGWLFGIWGEVLAELNDLVRATDKVKKGIKLITDSKDGFFESKSSLYLVRVLYSSGDLIGAEDIIQSMENRAREYNISLWDLRQLSTWQVRIWLAQGKVEAATQWIQEHDLDPDEKLTYMRELEHITLARILIAQGNSDDATRLLQRLFNANEEGGCSSRMIEVLLLQALSFQAQGNTDQANSSLEKALILAEPKGFLRIFIDEGSPMAQLLFEALNRGIKPDYVRRLLAAFSSVETEQTEKTKTQPSKYDLIEPLSEREIEILQLIAMGLTNQVIATRLYLSLHTVKVHARNIYAKLVVHNRTEAVNRARALGILDSH
jgi:LuxR family maltose regulon positive regulatory protein